MKSALAMLFVGVLLIGYSEAYARIKRGKITSPCMQFRFGCCPGSTTIGADGPHNEGCTAKGVSGCIDDSPGMCNILKDRGQLDCAGIDGRRCSRTCEKCRQPSGNKCQKGVKECCWDGSPKSPNIPCPDCRAVQQAYDPVCRRYAFKNNGCSSGSFKIQKFMNSYCPITCGIQC